MFKRRKKLNPKFDLEQGVKVEYIGLKGRISAVAFHKSGRITYLVEHINYEGVLTSSWQYEEHLKPTPDCPPLPTNKSKVIQFPGNAGTEKTQSKLL